MTEYVDGVLPLLRSEATAADIIDHLVEIEASSMGIDRSRAESERTVRLLLRWRALASR